MVFKTPVSPLAPTSLGLLVPLLLTLMAPMAMADRSERDMTQLIDDLRTLTDRSRKERAADRWLQRDLETLVARYDNPWRREILFEDFRDGDYDRNPRWQVLNGDFHVERGNGLRTSTSADPYSSQSEQTASPESALSDMLVGAALDSFLGPSKEQQQAQPKTDSPAGPAEIRVPAEITNAFAIDASFSLRDQRDRSRVELAVLQGNSAKFGYRLILSSGERRVIELERIRNGRVSIVDGAKLDKELADGRRHDLSWQQSTDGSIKISIDGQPGLSVKDKAFRDGYQWFQVGLEAGDLTLHRLEIKGTD